MPQVSAFNTQASQVKLAELDDGFEFMKSKQDRGRQYLNTICVAIARFTGAELLLPAF